MSSRLTLSVDVIRAMTDHAVFGIPQVYIPLRDDSKMTAITLFLSAHDGLEPDGFPISGFPRVLLGEAAASKPRRAPVRASSEQTLPSSIANCLHRAKDEVKAGAHLPADDASAASDLTGTAATCMTPSQAAPADLLVIFITCWYGSDQELQASDKVKVLVVLALRS